MKKHTTNTLTAASVNHKAGIKNISPKRILRYLYTEEDLGEGLLDAGVNSTYSTGQERNFKLVPWISMMRSKIS